MFDVAPTELLLVAFVALVVIGPKDLPRVMRVVGQWVGRARGMARHFRAGFDTMVREAELEEMEKKWAQENERIMREHPAPPSVDTPEPPIVAAAPPAFEAPAAFEASDAPMLPLDPPVARPAKPRPLKKPRE